MPLLKGTNDISLTKNGLMFASKRQDYLNKWICPECDLKVEKALRSSYKGWIVICSNGHEGIRIDEDVNIKNSVEINRLAIADLVRFGHSLLQLEENEEGGGVNTLSVS